VFVLVEERRIRVEFIPDQSAPAPRPENAQELGARFRGFEPMECLTCRYEIDRARCEASLFGACIDRPESRTHAGQFADARLPHGVIRFHADHLVAVLEKNSAEIARSAPNVGNYGGGHQIAFSGKGSDDLTRITGPVTNLVVNAIGKPQRGVQARSRFL
jgi:hypothetical protein